MAGGTTGMDIDQVTNFANSTVKGAADQLTSLSNSLKSAADGLQWTGTDAEQFKGGRMAEISAAFNQLVGKLTELAATVSANAAEQSATSSRL